VLDNAGSGGGGTETWKEIATNAIADFNASLFETIECAGGTPVSGPDNEVAPGKLAPGTKGNFGALQVRNDSDVTAHIRIQITLTNNMGCALSAISGETPCTGPALATCTHNVLSRLAFTAGDGTWTAGTKTYAKDFPSVAYGGVETAAPAGSMATLTASDLTWTWPISDGSQGSNPLNIPDDMFKGGTAANQGYTIDTPIGIWLAKNPGTSPVNASIKVFAVQVD
jgi:hypothetical protein